MFSDFDKACCCLSKILTRLQQDVYKRNGLHNRTQYLNKNLAEVKFLVGLVFHKNFSTWNIVLSI